MPPAPASPCAQKPAAIQDELAVGGERLGTVDEPKHLGVLQQRHPDDRVFHQLLEPVPVLVEQPAVEVRRDAVEPPWRRVPLVAAHDEAAGLAPEVDEQRRVAHRRQLERQIGRPCHEVLVRHRDHRDRDAGQLSDLGREHPAGVDDDLGLDAPLVGLDRLDPARRDFDRVHPCVGLDLGAAAPGALGEREGELARVDVAVGGEVGGAAHPFGGHRREKALSLLRGDQLER